MSSIFRNLPFTPVVKRIMLLTVGVWLILQVIVGVLLKLEVWHPLALYPYQVIENFRVWQLLTYIFLHSVTSPMHLIFNMLMLWFFGSELEKHWGSKFFTLYYLGSGVGAAILYCLAVLAYVLITGLRTPLMIPVVGSSGALFGLLLAYGIIFAERETYFMGLFPLKAKYFVMIVGGVDFAMLLSSGFAGSEVAYLAHLGGILAGFLILRFTAFRKAKNVKDRLKKKNPPLKLVVDNEKKPNKDNPKYWN